MLASVAPDAVSVWIDTPDPLVNESLRAALRDRAGVTLATANASSHVLIWDASASPALARERLTTMPHDRPVLALVPDGSDATAFMTAGARGVMRRQLQPSRLVAALRALAEGLWVFEPELAPRLAVTAPVPRSAELQDALTAREREVLQLVADGLSNRRIADRLGITEHTIKFHLNAILEKLDVDSRTQAVVVALRRGLLWL